MSPPILQFRPEAGGGVHVDLERLIAGRLLVQGSSGAGKSFMTRYLLEQTHGRIQQFIIDPEGEFATLRERFDYVVASADGNGDVPADPKSADLLCRQLMELEASAILDIYELDPEDRQEFVARFLHRLVNMPKGAWRPALVVVDEAHEFAPESGSAPPSKRPMELVVSKGRKRGLGAIYLTQRLSKLSKNASDLQNVLIGYTGLDTDIRRAGDILGFDKEQREGLKRLDPGEFFAFGPAISREVTKVRSGEIQTHHPEPGEIRAPTAPPRGRLQELVAQLEGIEGRAAEEEQEVENLRSEVARLRRELRSARNAEAPAAVDEEEIREKLLEEFTDGLHRNLADAMAAAVAHVATRTSGPLALLADRSAKARDATEAVEGAVEELADALRDLVNDPPAPEDLGVGGFFPLSGRAVARRPPEFTKQRPQLTTQPTDPSILDGKLSPRHQRILDALARLEAMGIPAPSRTILAAVASYSPKSSGYEKAVSRLSALELVHYPAPGDVALTPEGRGVAAPPTQAVTVQELHAAWFRILKPRHVRILQPLIDCYPAALSREELAERSEYSALSSGYEKAISRLSSFGLVHYPQPGHVAATDLLFPEGLT